MKKVSFLTLVLLFFILGGTLQAVVYEDDFSTDKYLTDTEYIYYNPMNQSQWQVTEQRYRVTLLVTDLNDANWYWDYLIYEFNDCNMPKITADFEMEVGEGSLAVAYQDPCNNPDSPYWEYCSYDGKNTPTGGVIQVQVSVDTSGNPYYNNSKFWLRIGLGAYKWSMPGGTWTNLEYFKVEEGDNTVFSFYEEFASPAYNSRAEYLKLIAFDHFDVPVDPCDIIGWELQENYNAGWYDGSITYDNENHEGENLWIWIYHVYQVSSPNKLLSNPIAKLRGRKTPGGYKLLNVSIDHGKTWYDKIDAWGDEVDTLINDDAINDVNVTEILVQVGGLISSTTFYPTQREIYEDWFSVDANASAEDYYIFVEHFGSPEWKNRPEYVLTTQKGPGNRDDSTTYMVPEYDWSTEWNGFPDGLLRYFCSVTGPAYDEITHLYEFTEDGYLFSDPVIKLNGKSGAGIGYGYFAIQAWNGTEWEEVQSTLDTGGWSVGSETIELDLTGDPNFQNLPVLKVKIMATVKYSNPPSNNIDASHSWLEVVARKTPTADEYYRFTERFLSDDYNRPELIGVELTEARHTYLVENFTDPNDPNDYPQAWGRLLFYCDVAGPVYNYYLLDYEFSEPNYVLSDPQIILSGFAEVDNGYGVNVLYVWDPVAKQWLLTETPREGTWVYPHVLVHDLAGDPNFQNLNKIKVKVGSTTKYLTASSTNGIAELEVIAKKTPVAPQCGDENHPYPEYDLNFDCWVDIDELRVVALNWLEDNNP